MSWAAIIVASGVLGSAALVRLRRGTPRGTRMLAVGAVVDVLPGSLSLADAAAPAGALDALLIVFVVAGLMIAPSLGLLYRLDQRSRLVGHGLGSDVTDVRTVDPDLL